MDYKVSGQLQELTDEMMNVGVKKGKKRRGHSKKFEIEVVDEETCLEKFISEMK